MADNYYAYLYINDDVPIYVGKGTGSRAFKHLNASHNLLLDRKIKKLRRSGLAPSIELIHATNEVAAIWLERCFIAAFGRLDLNTGPLSNMTDGGEGISGAAHSAETRAKISAKITGIKRSQETRARVSAARKRTAATPETRAAMSLDRKGRKFSDAHRASISSAMKLWHSSREYKDAASPATTS